MTNEEIQRKITIALSVDTLGPNACQPDMPLDYQQRLADAGRELVLQAYEEATRAACTLCEVERALEKRGNSPVHWHPRENQSSVVCQASGIHALKDLLVQETVSN